jgi:hypothetical protein
MNRKPAIPRPGEAKRGPEGHVGYLLRQASVALRGAMDRALAELGVTTPQFSVLTMIAAYPGASGADLARLTFLTPQAMLKRCRARVAEVERELAGLLGKDEERLVRRWLSAVAEKLAEDR